MPKQRWISISQLDMGSMVWSFGQTAYQGRPKIEDWISEDDPKPRSPEFKAWVRDFKKRSPFTLGQIAGYYGYSPSWFRQLYFYDKD